MVITGANGQLGTSLTHLLKDEFDVIALNQSQLDITCLASVEETIKSIEPDCVINCAAFTWVDGAEDYQKACYRVNEIGAFNLAKACEVQKSVLIHLSTDYVFDGQQDRPYLESDKPNPLNIYGKSKLAAEQTVIQHCNRHIIIRTASLFSLGGNNFCRSILNAAQNNKQLTIVDDQFSGPTFVDDLAKAIKKIITVIRSDNSQFEHWGIYHYCGEPIISWYDFALEVLKSQGYDIKELNCSAIKLSALNSKATRSKMSMLNNQKIQSVFDVKPSDWKAAIYQNKFKK